MSGDEIEIFLWRNSSLSRAVKVRPDGKISYPLIGTIRAAGLTIEKLQEKIKNDLSQYVRLPTENIIEGRDEIEVFVWKHRDLSRITKVRGDGKLSYPLIGTIQAAGLTVDRLQEVIKKKLAEYIKFPDVTVLIRKRREEDVIKSEDIQDVVVSILSFSDDKIAKVVDINVEIVSSAGNKVLVFGEVGIQGIYLYKGTISLLEAIAMAGGVQTTGKRESIIVVSGNMTENPEVRMINLFRVLRKGTSSMDLILRPNDVVYVPRTFIADVNRFYADIQPTIDQAMSVFDWRDKLRPWIKGITDE
jgi:polysaccharide export outer membrane protein